MSINPSSDFGHNEPLARLQRGTEALNIAWCQLPWPAKVVVTAGALAVAAPLLRSAAGNLDVEPVELLQLIQQI